MRGVPSNPPHRRRPSSSICSRPANRGRRRADNPRVFRNRDRRRPSSSICSRLADRERRRARGREGNPRVCSNRDRRRPSSSICSRLADRGRRRARRRLGNPDENPDKCCEFYTHAQDASSRVLGLTPCPQRFRLAKYFRH
jgi:hypothetical protein